MSTVNLTGQVDGAGRRAARAALAVAAPAVVVPPRAVQVAPSRRRTLAGYLVMPRPKDMFKALLLPLTFGLGVLVAGGTSREQLVRALVVLAALELLVYPARYQWNDIRGFVADQRHPAEADRGRLPGPLSRARAHVLASCTVALARLALTALLVPLLPGLRLGGILTWMTLGVFGVAIVYEALRAMATGRTGVVPPPLRGALVSLWVVVGAGYVVRGLTGLALAVDLHDRPLLGVAAGLTLWAYGVAFVTSRWAVEATAFARLQDGHVMWQAEAGQCREHLLALVRWLPEQFDRRDVPAGGGASEWAALRGRTSLVAPWNLALVSAGAAAAVTGRYLVGSAPPATVALTAVAGGLTAMAVAYAPHRRALAAVAGGAVLLLVLLAQRTQQPLVALLPWAAVAAAYAHFSRQSLATMGHLGAQLRARLLTLSAPALRVVLGSGTWDAVSGGASRG